MTDKPESDKTESTIKKNAKRAGWISIAIMITEIIHQILIRLGGGG